MSYERRRRHKDDDVGGTPSDYFHRRRRARRDAARAARPLSELTLDDVADPEHLIATYDDLRRRGGHAPGPDGVTYADLSRGEVALIMRMVAETIRIHYRPGPARKVPIPKPGGGRRVLTLRNVADRVVSAALARTLEPRFDDMFLPMPYGCRRGHGVLDMLSDILAYTASGGRYVVAVDDIRKAFDNVVVADVVDDFARHVVDGPLRQLIESVVRGNEDRDRRVGIDQGDPLSPLALNLRLHHVHDLPLAGERVFPPAFRYVDNVVYLGASVSDGHRALRQSRNLLSAAGLTLKGDDGPPTDLRNGGQAEVLGFVLRLEGGRPRLGLGVKAWKGLTQRLEETHEQPDPPGAARHVVLGWADAQGPAVEGTEITDVVEKILRVAGRQGFRELASREQLRRRLVESRGRWEVRLARACRRHGVDRDRPHDVEAPPPTVFPGARSPRSAPEASGGRGSHPGRPVDPNGSPTGSPW